uniref:Uncharacterized protein n=1 Tax=Arundo donax TaxID=35708 RepID=A0A0A9GNI2_ARUDO
MSNATDLRPEFSHLLLVLAPFHAYRLLMQPEDHSASEARNVKYTLVCYLHQMSNHLKVLKAQGDAH